MCLCVYFCCVCYLLLLCVDVELYIIIIMHTSTHHHHHHHHHHHPPPHHHHSDFTACPTHKDDPSFAQPPEHDMTLVALLGIQVLLTC